MDKNKDIIVKKIAEYLFNEWKQQKLDEGYHLPKCCPYYDKGNTDEDLVEDDIIHCNKCLINLGIFDEIDDFLKKEYLKKAETLYNKFLEIGLKIVI